MMNLSKFGGFFAKNSKLQWIFIFFPYFLIDVMWKCCPKNFLGISGYDEVLRTHVIFLCFLATFFQALVKLAGIKIDQKFCSPRSAIKYVYHQKKFHPHTSNIFYGEMVSRGIRIHTRTSDYIAAWKPHIFAEKMNFYVI